MEKLLHDECGGIISPELFPRSLQTHPTRKQDIVMTNRPEWIGRCDKCELVGVLFNYDPILTAS